MTSRSRNSRPPFRPYGSNPSVPRKLVLNVIDPRESAIWNSFVDSHPQGWITHRSEWYDVIAQASPTIRPHYLVAQRGKDGEIEAALPLCHVRSPLGRSRLVSLPYATLCDPLALNAEALLFLLEQLPEVMRQAGAVSVQLRTFQSADISSPLLSRRDDYMHHEIDLTRTEAELLASFDGGCVRNRIRKALKGPLRIREADSAGEMETFNELCVAARQRLGLPAQPRPFLEGLWRHLRPIGSLELLLIEQGSRIVGGLLLLRHGRRTSAEMLAYDPGTRALCPNHLVFWTAIRRAKAAGCLQFDFGRTPLAEEDLVSFKGRWGTVARPLPIFSHPPSSDHEPRKQGRFYNAIRAALRHSPRPLYHGLSRLYYRWAS